MVKNKKSNPTATMLVISTGFLVVYLGSHAKWALTVALLVGVVGIASKALSAKIDFVWMKLSNILGLIMPRILLSAVFYIFLFPIAVIARLFGKKETPFRKAPGQGSTFVNVNRVYSSESFENPW